MTKSHDFKIILAYPCGSNIITRVHTRGQGKHKSQYLKVSRKTGFEDGRGPGGKECRQLLEGGKGKLTFSPRDSRENQTKTTVATFDFSPMGLCMSFLLLLITTNVVA